MKNKIFIVFFLLTICFSAGAFFIHLSMEKFTSQLEEIIVLQHISMGREKTLHSLNVVQSDLLLKDSPFATNLDTFVEHVEKMDQDVLSCFDCHHEPAVQERLDNFAEKISVYMSNLSRVYTLRSNVERLNRERNNAHQEGEEIVMEMTDMVAFASGGFSRKLELTRKEIMRSRKLLDLLLILGSFFFLGSMVFLMKYFYSSVVIFSKATRTVNNGDWSYRIDNCVPGEFKELADGFNQMAKSLENKCYESQHLDRLTVVGELATGFIQEVREPLNGIKRSVEFLDGKLDLNEINKTLFQQIMSEIDRVGNILESLLSYARQDLPQYKSVNVNTILESALKSTRYSLKGDRQDGNNVDINITYELDKYLPQIKADSSQLLQLFLNLLLHAVGVTKPQGTISACTSIQPSGHIQVEIADSGPAISDTEIVEIFDPFLVSKGVRHGLVICKQLVEQQGGTISVTNREQGGVVFTILFPIK